MKAALALPLLVLAILPLVGCYPLYLQTQQARQAVGNYEDRRAAKRPLPQTAVEYAPEAPPPVSATPVEGGEPDVGRLLQVDFEDAASVRTYGVQEVRSRGGVLDNPLTELLHRGGGGMAVTVVRRMYDGRLLVRGEKPLRDADGGGTMQLEGIVDPRDIARNGSVASNRIAEARLGYVGGSGRGRPLAVEEMAHYFQGGGGLN